MSKATEQPVVTTLETTKRSIYMMDPATVLVVGIDFGDESTPGYDRRVKLPLDPQLTASIKSFGVIRPILARKDGERVVAVDGRRRVMHARAANLELQAANPGIEPEQLIKIKVELIRGDEMSLLSTSHIANAYAVQNAPMDEAADMQRMIDKGAGIAQVALAFGRSEIVVSDRLKLLDLAPEAAALVAKEQLTANAALEIVGLPMADQVRVLQKVRDEAVGVKANGKLDTRAVTTAARAVRAETGKGAAVRQTPKERVAAAYKELEALARGVAESGKPMSADGRTSSQPDSAAMFQVCRKALRILHPDNKTWDSVVKSLIPQEEEHESPKAPKAAAK